MFIGSKVTKSARETMKFGERFARDVSAGCVIGLVGQLGSGKTCFVKGLARGLGVEEPRMVISPTFVLLNIYPGRVRLCHYDLYRLDDGDEIVSLGFLDYVKDSVVVIEWAEKVSQEILGQHIRITFEIIGKNKRKITSSTVLSSHR